MLPAKVVTITYSAPPDPLAGFKGPTSKGREGKGGRGGEKGEGGHPRLLRFPPGPRGARIVTGLHSVGCGYCSLPLDRGDTWRRQ